MEGREFWLHSWSCIIAADSLSAFSMICIFNVKPRLFIMGEGVHLFMTILAHSSSSEIETRPLLLLNKLFSSPLLSSLLSETEINLSTARWKISQFLKRIWRTEEKEVLPEGKKKNRRWKGASFAERMPLCVLCPCFCTKVGGDVFTQLFLYIYMLFQYFSPDYLYVI